MFEKNADEASKARGNAESDASATKTQKEQAEQDRLEAANVLKTAREILAKIEEVNQFSQSELEQASDISIKAGR